MKTIYDLSFKDPSGKEISLDAYRGKVLIIVNTATKCGLASQFTELEALQKKYKSKGLVVIGFPCDQFLGQEPETNESMVGVCQLNFGVTFQLSEKINVNGRKTHPVFNYLKNHSGSRFGRKIRWNFTKFLVSRDGSTIERFAPTTKPDSMIPSIEKQLKS